MNVGVDERLRERAGEEVSVMRRLARVRTMGIMAGAAAVCALFPGVALAADGGGASALSTVAGIAALVMAAFLMVVILRLEQVAKGGALAERVSLAMAATLCLGAAALVNWLGRYLSDVSPGAVRAAADLLLAAALGLLAAYFLRIHRSLTSFLKGSKEMLRKMEAAERDLDPDTPDLPEDE